MDLISNLISVLSLAVLFLLKYGVEPVIEWTVWTCWH